MKEYRVKLILDTSEITGGPSGPSGPASQAGRGTPPPVGSAPAQPVPSQKGMSWGDALKIGIASQIGGNEKSVIRKKTVNVYNQYGQQDDDGIRQMPDPDSPIPYPSVRTGSKTGSTGGWLYDLGGDESGFFDPKKLGQGPVGGIKKVFKGVDGLFTNIGKDMNSGLSKTLSSFGLGNLDKFLKTGLGKFAKVAAAALMAHAWIGNTIQKAAVYSPYAAQEQNRRDLDEIQQQKWMGGITQNLSALDRFFTKIVNIGKNLLVAGVDMIAGAVRFLVTDPLSQLFDWAGELFGAEEGWFSGHKSKKDVKIEAGTKKGGAGPITRMPLVLPPVAQISPTNQLYLGMNASVDTRAAAQEAVMKIRDQLLYNIDRGVSEQNMFMNELKSLNYIRMI